MKYQSRKIDGTTAEGLKAAERLQAHGWKVHEAATFDRIILYKETYTPEEIEAINYLKGIIKPGDVIYTSLKHVSRSGMYRVIDLYIMKNNEPWRISGYAAHLLEGYDRRHEGCRAGGCGMDMGFHLVYNLASVLFRDGFQCPGDGCPSNDHNNAPHPAADGTMYHKGGGYALKQRWL